MKKGLRLGKWKLCGHCQLKGRKDIKKDKSK